MKDKSLKSVKERGGLENFAKFIPLRLTAEERTLLAVLEQTLHVSEYTDLVDVTSARRGNKVRRILDGILEACHIATGLAVSGGHERTIAAPSQGDMADSAANTKSKKASRKLKKQSKRSKKVAAAESSAESSGKSWCSRTPKENEVFFQTIFEIGRRNKVLNPSSMRSTYGKCMYLMQDAHNGTIAKSLGFSIHKELLLVGPYLKDHDCADLLHDPRLRQATRYITDRDEVTGEKLEDHVVRAQVEEKRRLCNEMVAEYSSKSSLSPDQVQRVMDSLSDAFVTIESNVAPVKRMLRYLEDNFDPENPTKEFSLQLRGSGRVSSGFSHYNRYGFSAYGPSRSDGPTLSHNHSTQFMFVWQSLRLWCKVMLNMHRLWVCADEDLLSASTSYQLFNTGQGLNRVQSCPSVGKIMRNLLHATQQEANAGWVGLSVIHLGDRDVPNALIFIDKYTQIPRFLNPLVNFLAKIPELCEDERVATYIDNQFGSADALKMTVLADYFKHGFDGSGDDGGSCIDGRLTSSWNWTSRIAKKTYYHAFMLSGFQGFDGDFK